MTIFRAHIVNAKDNSNIGIEDFELDTSEIDNRVYEGVDADEAERLRAQQLIATANEEAVRRLNEGEKIDQVTVVRGF